MHKPSFWEWIQKTFLSTYQDDIAAYLAQSTDEADLEHRMRKLSYKGLL